MTRPLRVVHVIARMNVGGPAVLIANAMRTMNSADFDVRLVTGYCGDGEADYLQTQAVDLPAIRLDGLGRSIRPKADLTSATRLATLLHDLRPDIVHTHTAKAGVVGRVAVPLSRSGAKIVHTYHGHLLHGYFPPAKTKAVVAAERVLAHWTDRLIAVAPQVRDDLLAAHIGRPSQYEVIVPGVALDSLPERDLARRELGLPLGRPVVTMMGRITGIKRPDRFIEVVRLIARTHPGVWFAVAGAGDLEEDLRQSVAGLPVSLLGWQSDVERVLAASEALVLTSDNEGTPLSLIQAGLAGLPVVATSVGGVTSVVDDGQTGLLAAPDAMALAAALTCLLDDPALADRLGRTAKERMTQRFGMADMVQRHADLYWGLRSP